MFAVTALCFLLFLQNCHVLALIPGKPSTESDGLQRGSVEAQRPLKEAEEIGKVQVTNVGDGLNESLDCSALQDAIHIMQDHFFAVAHGVWPDAIDWTSAVMGTHISATLSAMCQPVSVSDLESSAEIAENHENVVNHYFSQLLAFYFGENAFSLRNQAYDDMLWVVLDWLEAIQFIERHSVSFLSNSPHITGSGPSAWYARQFIPQFAHRARIFYNLASQGWDETLCGGGMLWSPYLAPYKNAITNELFIAASISMYLYFPGDDDGDPFVTQEADTQNLPPVYAKDEKYLENALKAYDWLQNSGMSNDQGLYVDGFHIKGWRRGRSNGTGECDLRDDMVYTYNQGVILTGQRGLWQSTGRTSFLEDGHKLINSVIAATGWKGRDKPGRWHWAGMGRNGVLEDICDWSGLCSQNGQTFKGIFFHHFSVFCEPLPYSVVEVDAESSPSESEVRAWHDRECKSYSEWATWNQRAATVTKDAHGEFGQWWGRRAGPENDDEHDESYEKPIANGTDYRNFEVPDDEIWQPEKDSESRPDQKISTGPRQALRMRSDKVAREHDINDRGRGRTVETQSGGLAVVRAAWKLSQQIERGERERK